MKLYVTTEGIARQEGDLLLLLDVPERELGAVLARDGLSSLAGAGVRSRQPLAEATLLSPIAAPGTFVIAGLNYRPHCEEIGIPIPEKLLFGFAPGSAASGPHAPIPIPAEAPDQIDYEGELALVIGKTADAVSANEAWEHVAGICALDDVSARDVQAGGIASLGPAKGFPGFKPFGPALRTTDELTLPLDLAIETRVNGELRQRARTSDLIFDVPAIIEAVSAVRALGPGDVVCTGTPGGVAHGGEHPYLKAGDVVEVALEGLPPLRNEVAPAA